MEATVDKLEAMFDKAEKDLDYLSSKLEVEFEETRGVGDQINPMKLMQKIDDIKKDYSAVVKEAQAIKDTQEEAVNFCKGELMNLCTTLQKLQTNAGMTAEVPEELNNVQQMLGITPETTTTEQDVTSPSHNETLTMSQEDDGQAAMANQNEGKDHTTSQKRKLSSKKKGDQKPSAELSAATEKRSNEEFTPITDEEFKSVSSLIRGRVKLSEINQAYQILWRHFVEEGNTKALSPTAMFNMGLKVAGQSGEAKLKVLRALKLLHISSKGEVKLL